VNLLEPWVLLRMVAGVVATALFLRAAQTASRVLRHWDVAGASEGQLALEKQLDLARTYVRVAAVVQVAALLLSVMAADRLSRGVRGAMCGWGVFSANPWGFRAITTSAVVALVAGIVAQVFSFDARVRTFSLARPLAWATLAVAPLSAIDLAIQGQFLLDLDLTVVSSCCSVQVDTLGVSTDDGFAAGPRVLVSWAAALSVLLALGLALWARGTPSRARVTAAGLASLLALPLAVGASMLEVAPHAFETPHHACPFCLFKPEVLALGYPLFGAMLLAAIRGGGAAVCAILARGADVHAAFAAFARRSLSLGAAAWGVAALVAAAPVVRYLVLSHGAPLFP
jgi:hypothetical protein